MRASSYTHLVGHAANLLSFHNYPSSRTIPVPFAPSYAQAELWRAPPCVADSSRAHPEPESRVILTGPSSHAPSQAEAKERYGADAITVHKTTFVNMLYSREFLVEGQFQPKTFAKLVCLGPEQARHGQQRRGKASLS
jgi:hypothetical protein